MSEMVVPLHGVPTVQVGGMAGVRVVPGPVLAFPSLRSDGSVTWVAPVPVEDPS